MQLRCAAARRRPLLCRAASTGPPEISQTEPTSLAAVASQGPLTRQVFISHTGLDKDAMTFAACILKPAMEAAGLKVYMDFSNLEPGSAWPEELMNAAANSAVVVVLLSKQYTQRFWCMLELDLALNSRKQLGQQKPLVVPVFFDEAESIVQPDKIQAHWTATKTQLSPARRRRAWVDPKSWTANIVSLKAQLQHLRLPAQGGSKDHLITLARRVVAAAVAAIPRVVPIAAKPVGTEQQEAQLVAQLVVDDPTRLGLWLYGCGGSGKTTMSQLLFNRLAPHFQHSTFIELTPEEGISRLKEHLVTALTELGARGFNEQGSAPMLLNTLCEYVCDKDVLIVLDNVWSAGQLDGLLPTTCGPGSSLIITSRQDTFPDSNWLKQVKRSKQEMIPQELELLCEADAKSLFREFADLPQTFQLPNQQLRDAEDAIIAAAAGLPLALRLVGALLSGNDKKLRPLTEWKAALEALQCGDVDDVDTEGKLKAVLSLSFDKLDAAQQHMFLDVATMLCREAKDQAMAVWTAWHGQRARLLFAGLERRSLLSTDDKGQLQMHDVLAYLGRGIVLDSKSANPYYGSRVWMQDGKVKGHVAGRAVLAAQLDFRTADAALFGSGPQATPGLDLAHAKIILMGHHNKHSPSATGTLNIRRLPTGLLWLRATGIEHMEYPTDAACQLWSLCVLDLSCSKLHQLPETVGQLSALQELDLSECGKLNSLPNTFGQLSALRRLNLHGCGGLADLPESFGQLSALQHLNLSRCCKLTCLPESFGHLSSLQALDLKGCAELSSLSQSCGLLSALQVLNLRGCGKLDSLPDSFGQLLELQRLDLNGCYGLRSLPESFGQLSALQQLDLTGCYKLGSLPESFGQLSALQQLDLTGGYRLGSLPESFGQLSALQQLNIAGCGLRSLPESFGQLSALQWLDLSHCHELRSVPESFGQLSALQYLYRRSMPHLSALPGGIKYLAASGQLYLSGCHPLSGAGNELEQYLAKEFQICDVRQSMMWIEHQKTCLEQQLGERWAEGLYQAGSTTEDPEVARHRRVAGDFWSGVARSIVPGKGLDETFFDDGVWLHRAKEYRLLFEPVEIAYYYFANLHHKYAGKHYIDQRYPIFDLLEKMEQRVNGRTDPNYTTQSSLGLAQLLKDGL